jgi:hypothetical protein
MPYIPPNRRTAFDRSLETLAEAITSEGELNYCIYKLSCLLVDRLGASYDNLSLCSSAMEHAKLEWYRRRVVPYEEEKIRQNGDI